jgi:hypothetical protein
MARAVCVRGVDERHAEIEGAMNRVDRSTQPVSP